MITKLLSFIRSWILLFAIIAGISAYFIYINIPFLDATHVVMLNVIQSLQIVLIFCMLFLAFCKVNPRRLKLRPWHWWLLLIQSSLFVGLGIIVMMLPNSGVRVILEGAMICFICPVGSAAPVLTKKLGGSATDITTYTILINTVVAILVPIMVPLVHPQSSMSIVNASLLIMGKIFPLLLLPMLLAFLVRALSPKLHFIFSRQKDLAFYFWVISLFLAIGLTTRYIMHTTVSLSVELSLIAVSLISCVLQFWTGRKIGERYEARTTAGQALGQKNPVIAIWFGYTFFTPITSLAGGFYSIFQNIINSAQLHAREKNLRRK